MMSYRRFHLGLLLVLLGGPAPLHAGLHYSGEDIAELPARWRGFLLDQRALRLAGARPAAGAPASPLRLRYEKEAGRLVQLMRDRSLSPDETADLGALYVRLGDIPRALEVLRPAYKAHPRHYRLAANLGTSWQLTGELPSAAGCLEQAVRLSPGRLQKAEELHLKLVRLRLRERPGTQELDDLFGVRYLGPSGKYEPGKLAPSERRKLPSGAIAHTQLLALWLPADGRLLWQLAELAGVQGDLTTSAAILDGCVTEFGLRSTEIQAHRKQMRAAVEERARTTKEKKEHEEEADPLFKPRSSRPLVSRGKLELPAIDPKGDNPLPWEVLAETTLDRMSRPTFVKYLRELDGKQVQMRGFMQPLGEGADLGAFMFIENPVGCWYCEMPELAGIVLVEMPAGKAAAYTRNALTITGKLSLNATDPENFLYILKDARIRGGE